MADSSSSKSAYMPPPKAVPIKGDRSAFDVNNYPTYHANDLEAGKPIYHLPGPASNPLAVPKWDGQKVVWVNPVITVIFTISGALTTTLNPVRFYNTGDYARTITKVHISVDTPSGGQSVIVDVHKDGTTLFTTQSNRPTITASQYTGQTTTIENASWAVGSYLQIQPDQVGTSTVAKDLTVTVFYQEGT